MSEPFKSLPKLFSLFPLSTNNAVNSLKTLKSLDYLSHFVVTQKCSNLKQLQEAAPKVSMASLNLKPIGQLLYMGDN